MEKKWFKRKIKSLEGWGKVANWCLIETFSVSKGFSLDVTHFSQVNPKKKKEREYKLTKYPLSVRSGRHFRNETFCLLATPAPCDDGGGAVS